MKIVGFSYWTTGLATTPIVQAPTPEVSIHNTIRELKNILNQFSRQRFEKALTIIESI